MTISSRGLQLIKNFEGFRSEPYLCPAGVPTIGYGTTYYPSGKKVTLRDDNISKILASNILKWQINRSYAKAVNRYAQIELNQNQFDALTSFAYNLGIGALQRSTLLRHVNQGRHKKAAKEFHRWVYANGRKLKGLVRRRKAESALYKK